MARTRLRDARTPGEEQAFYAHTYPDGYRHDVWPDHVERVNASARFLRRWISQFPRVADLSCGDGALARSLEPEVREIYLGDLNGVRGVRVPDSSGTVVHVLPPGALPDSLALLPRPVDLFILSETIEHMDDPDELLTLLQPWTRYLFLSTPVSERSDSGNREHYWSWSTADMHEMLRGSGWVPLESEVLVPESTRHLDGAYHYQLWLAVRR